MDLSAGVAAAARAAVPQIVITFDKFHVAMHLNKAVDQTRRQEHQALQEAGDQRLKGQRWLFLINPAQFTDQPSEEFEQLLKIELKTGPALGLQGAVHRVLGAGRRGRRQEVS